jgi:hypothetical protein
MTGKFKYTINYYVSILPPYVTIDHIHDVLFNHYGISVEQFRADRYLEIDDAGEIPVSRLLAYSRVVAIPIDQLIQPNITSL